MKKSIFLVALFVAVCMTTEVMAYDGGDYEDDSYYDEYYDDGRYDDEDYEDDSYRDEDYEDEGYDDEDRDYDDEDYDDEDEDYDDENGGSTVAGYVKEYGTIMIVDLSDQHVYCYVDGEMIADADCVSGDLYDSSTPTGLYEVWGKQSDYYMQGRYYTSYATFFNGGIAIHDADAWRDEYGGSIYQGGGSHGCVNTPGWFAEIVYENSEIGTPVYVF